jgi:toxin ParE1/3/4
VRVLFTASAERQLDRLHRYIAERASEPAADRYVGRIISFCEGLSIFPLRGAAREDLLPGLRTIGFERRATIAFMVTDHVVLVEGVFYGGQDFEANFRE